MGQYHEKLKTNEENASPFTCHDLRDESLAREYHLEPGVFIFYKIPAGIDKRQGINVEELSRDNLPAIMELLIQNGCANPDRACENVKLSYAGLSQDFTLIAIRAEIIKNSW